MARSIDPRRDPAPPKGLGRATLRLYLGLLWPRDDPGQKLRVLLAMALISGAALASTSAPAFFAHGVDRLAEGGGRGLLGPVAAYGGLYWLSRSLSELRWWPYGWIENRMRRRLGTRALEHLHGLSLRFHLMRRTGEVGRVLENGERGLVELTSQMVLVVLPLVVEVGFAATMLALRLPLVFAALLLGTLAVYVTVLFWSSEQLRQVLRAFNREKTIAKGEAIDGLLNYETIKHFTGERRAVHRYDRRLTRTEILGRRGTSTRARIGLLSAAIIGSGMGLTLWLGSARVASGAMSVGDLVLVNTYLLLLVRPLERMGLVYRQLRQASIDLELLVELLGKLPEVVDAPDAKALPRGPGDVRFENVAFGYDAARPIVESLSFHIPPGRTLALVGQTGAGKSTIARLLSRFYDPDEGRILLDGHDLRDLTQLSLRGVIAVVPQDTVLFNSSIGSNIAVGRPGASDVEIAEAARRAQLHAFIESLPEGYETLVGERGLRLSGGEKQRVALARAILKRPRIFILDEATSALDTRTESLAQAALDAASVGATTLIIAHRLSTITHADEILVLDKGPRGRARHA